MKYRNGFVSNSSSSSFIVDQWNENDKKYTVEEVEEELKKLLDFYNDYFDDNLEYEEVFFVYEHSGNPHEGWEDYYCQLINKNNEKRIIIDSIEDNIIPYCLFDMIDAKFKTSRIHLG